MSRNVTLVVPIQGRVEELERLLAEVNEQARGGPPLPVIVADDASVPPVSEQLRGGNYRELVLQVVRSDVNGGPGAARNFGLQHVRTGWVAFVDSDEIPGRGWLARLDAIVSDEAAWPAVEGVVDDGGQAAGPFTHAGTLAGGSHISGNLAFRTELLRRVGGFDERFYDPRLRLHFREDTELFFRLDAIGTPLRRDGRLLVHHPPHRPSMMTPLRDARRYYFDPLLAREHGERFRAFNRRQRVGPVSLRTARHVTAVGQVGSVLVASASLLARRRGAAGAAGSVAAVTWAANVAALAWRRRIRPGDVLPLLLVALGVPWVYVLYYYRGVRRFRHLPRL